MPTLPPLTAPEMGLHAVLGRCRSAAPHTPGTKAPPDGGISILVTATTFPSKLAAAPLAMSAQHPRTSKCTTGASALPGWLAGWVGRPALAAASCCRPVQSQRARLTCTGAGVAHIGQYTFATATWSPSTAVACRPDSCPSCLCHLHKCILDSLAVLSRPAHSTRHHSTAALFLPAPGVCVCICVCLCVVRGKLQSHQSL